MMPPARHPHRVAASFPVAQRTPLIPARQTGIPVQASPRRASRRAIIASSALMRPYQRHQPCLILVTSLGTTQLRSIFRFLPDIPCL